MSRSYNLLGYGFQELLCRTLIDRRRNSDVRQKTEYDISECGNKRKRKEMLQPLSHTIHTKIYPDEEKRYGTAEETVGLAPNPWRRRKS